MTDWVWASALEPQRHPALGCWEELGLEDRFSPLLLPSFIHLRAFTECPPCARCGASPGDPAGNKADTVYILWRRRGTGDSDITQSLWRHTDRGLNPSPTAVWLGVGHIPSLSLRSSLLMWG